MPALAHINERGEIVRAPGEPAPRRKAPAGPQVCDEAAHALLWGLLALLCPGFGLFGLPAILQGARAVVRVRRGKGRLTGLGHAITGMAFGAAGLLGFVALLAWVALRWG